MEPTRPAAANRVRATIEELAGRLISRPLGRDGEQFMNPVRSVAFHNEIALAKELIAKGELEASFAHLERAHIIGQPFVVPHVDISMFKGMPIEPELQNIIHGVPPNPRA
jgi:hypothetical protein